MMFIHGIKAFQNVIVSHDIGRSLEQREGAVAIASIKKDGQLSFS